MRWKTEKQKRTPHHGQDRDATELEARDQEMAPKHCGRRSVHIIASSKLPAQPLVCPKRSRTCARRSCRSSARSAWPRSSNLREDSAVQQRAFTAGLCCGGLAPEGLEKRTVQARLKATATSKLRPSSDAWWTTIRCGQRACSTARTSASAWQHSATRTIY